MNENAVIGNYLEENNPVAASLKQFFKTIKVNIQPLRSLLTAVGSIKDIQTAEKLFVQNKALVQKVLMKSLSAVDPFSIPDGGTTEEEQPKKQPTKSPKPPSPKKKAPANKKEAESRLKKIFEYIKSKIPAINLEWATIKDLFYKFFVVVVRILEAKGLMAVVATMGAPLVLGICSILTITCILNAFFRTKDLEEESLRISLKESFDSIVNGFKKMVTSWELQKGEMQLAGISVFLVFFVNWLTHHIAWTTAGGIIGAVVGGTGGVAGVLTGAVVGGTSGYLISSFMAVVLSIFVLYYLTEMINEFSLQKIKSRE